MTINVEEIGYAEDDSCGGYEWGFTRVLTAGGKVWTSTEAGCSCNGPDSGWATYEKVPDDACDSLLELAERVLKKEMFGRERVEACAVLNAMVRALKTAKENG